MSRSSEGRVFKFSLERLGRGLSETIVSCKAVPKVLGMKYYGTIIRTGITCKKTPL